MKCFSFSEVNDLQKFVSVALHTSAGEDDYCHDRLSNLKVVASGYSPLIYKLKANSGFDNFQNYCREVWVSLDQTPKLPSLLVSTLIVFIFYFFKKQIGFVL